MGTIEQNVSGGRPARRALLVVSVVAWSFFVVVASAAFFSTEGAPGPSFRSALTGPLELLGESRTEGLLFALVPSLAAVILVGWGIWANGYIRVLLGSILGTLVWLALSFFFAFLHQIV